MQDFSGDRQRAAAQARHRRLDGPAFGGRSGSLGTSWIRRKPLERSPSQPALGGSLAWSPLKAFGDGCGFGESWGLKCAPSAVLMSQQPVAKVNTNLAFIISQFPDEWLFFAKRRGVANVSREGIGLVHLCCNVGS